MLLESTLAVSRTCVSQLCRHGVHGYYGSRVVTQHGTCAGTALDTRTWLRGDIPGLRLIDEDIGLLRGWGCNILAQGLIGLIGYLYQQVTTFFPKAHLQITLKLSVLGLEKFTHGCWPESSSWVRMSEDKVRKKDWCCSVRAIYVLQKLLDISRPDLVEAERYNVYFIVLACWHKAYIYFNQLLLY